MPIHVFYDTEFTGLSSDAVLISAGFITEAGNEYYAELADFDERACSAFVGTKVLPLLGASRITTATFVASLTTWLSQFGNDLQLIADSDWDRRLLVQTFASSGQSLPEHWQFLVVPACYPEGWRRRLFDDEMAAHFLRHLEDQPHHALADARALRSAYWRAEYPQ